MSEEQKPTNVEAEKDVQNVLAELKGENGQAEEASKEDNEEARIVAEAAKLGEKSESNQRDGGFRNRRNAARFDPSTQKETDDPVQIRKQVEFYFSDSNLPMDKFLMGLVGGSENKAVPLETLHSFKRMRRFKPFTAVVEALKTAETVELADNDTAVKRKVPLPENSDDSIKVFEDKAMGRSIYAKGFGREEGSTQYDIEAFFAPFGPINAIRLRRGDDKGFKGSVFVEFESEDKQKAFLELDDKPKWNGRELIVKSKKQYCEEKVEEIKSGNVRPSRGRGGPRGRGRGGRGGRGNNRNDRNDRGDSRDWRERRAQDQKNGFKDEAKKEEPKKDDRGVPVVESTADASQKRPREEEGNAEPPAKKVDAKE